MNPLGPNFVPVGTFANEVNAVTKPKPRWRIVQHWHDPDQTLYYRVERLTGLFWKTWKHTGLTYGDRTYWYFRTMETAKIAIENTERWEEAEAEAQIKTASLKKQHNIIVEELY